MNKHKRKYPVKLANLLTTASILVSFYAIIAALDGNFTHSAAAIIIAAFLDAFDGRIARLTNTATSFGEHYDSLADVIAFGVAPALLAFCWGVGDFGGIGWGACFIFIACCCVRLARFSTNTGASSEGAVHFCGMPSPAAGGYIASLIWLLETYPLPHTLALLFVTVILTMTALLMVSTLPFMSSRRFILSSPALINLVLAIIYFGLLIARPAEVLFFSGCLYILITLVSSLRKQIKNQQPASPQPPKNI